MKFIGFSDTHIGGKFNEEMFQKGVEVINSTEADYYIFSGDLTDQGTLREYELAKSKYLPMIEKEVFYVPGNHDVKNVGDLLWEEILGPRYFVHTDEQKKVKLLGLDSNEPDKNTGRMGRKAIERVYEEFFDLDDEWIKVLVFHHQSLPIKYTGRERSALNDAGDTLKAIMDCNIDLVINGHRHISNVYRLTDGDIFTLIVNCGTMSCKKTRYREEYSVTEIEIDPDKVHARVTVHLLNSENNNKLVKFDSTFEGTDEPKKMRKIATLAQIGNTDISEDDFILENYSKGVKMINSLDNCDLILHNGDVTSHSYREEFELAKTLLAQFNKPLIVVPGPRDSYSLGEELFPKFIDQIDQTYETDDFRLMAFNSCILEEKIGRLGRSRSNKVSSKLTNDKLGIVGFHHTIIPLPRTKHESELQDAGDVLAMIVENKIDLVLTGAKNRAGSWQVDDTVFVNVGTLSSRNIVTPEGNSFNIIQIYETNKGHYYKIDEVFVETGDFLPLGKYHVIK